MPRAHCSSGEHAFTVRTDTIPSGLVTGVPMTVTPGRGSTGTLIGNSTQRGAHSTRGPAFIASLIGFIIHPEKGKLAMVLRSITASPSYPCSALRNQGCWRCGSNDHLRRDCPQPPSNTELDGMPRVCGPRRAMWSRGELRGRGTCGDCYDASSTVLSQMAGLGARIDLQVVFALLRRASISSSLGFFTITSIRKSTWSQLARFMSTACCTAMNPW